MAAGQLLGQTVQIFGNFNRIRSFQHFIQDNRVLFVLDFHADAHILVDRHVAIQGVILKDNRNITLYRGAFVNDFSIQDHFSRTDLLQTAQHSENRGFAAPGGADKHDKFPFINGKVKVVNGMEAIWVNLINVFELNFSHLLYTPPIL